MTSGRQKLITPSAGAANAPLYKDVKLQLIKMLSDEGVKPGVPIPIEKELCARFGVSIGTVRRAIGELVAERVLVRQQGRGTFVTSYSEGRMLNFFFRIFKKGGEREVPLVKTMVFSRGKANKNEATMLEIKTGQPVFNVRNVMILGGKPVVLDDITLPEKLFPGLTERMLVERDTTMYGLYQAEFGIQVLRTVDHLSAVAADAYADSLLGIGIGAPLLEISRVALTFNSLPVEYRRTLMYSERYEYINTMEGE